jgi:hypothetical protein
MLEEKLFEPQNLTTLVVSYSEPGKINFKEKTPISRIIDN